LIDRAPVPIFPVTQSSQGTRGTGAPDYSEWTYAGEAGGKSQEYRLKPVSPARSPGAGAGMTFMGQRGRGEIMTENVSKPAGDLKKAAGWSIVLGIVLLVLGVIAILFPLASSLAAAIWVAWLLVIGGGVLLAHAIRTRRESGFWLKLLWSIVYLVAGLLLLASPVSGVLTLTLVLAVLWIIEGATAIALAFRLKPARPWGWVLFDGILTALLGLLVWVGWPGNAPWLLGLFLGLSLLSTGISVLLFGWAIRSGHFVPPSQKLGTADPGA
jgi:uncharacterized membrane protein HdeD (DUF308 family)